MYVTNAFQTSKEAASQLVAKLTSCAAASWPVRLVVVVVVVFIYGSLSSELNNNKLSALKFTEQKKRCEKYNIRELEG